MAPHPTQLGTPPKGTVPGPFGFFLVYFVTALGLLITQRGGLYVLAGPIAIAFVAVPLLDAIIGSDDRNPPEAPPRARTLVAFRLATWFAVPFEAALLAWGLWKVTHTPVSWVEFIGYVVAIGMTGGVTGITVAHELVHRPDKIDRWLGNALLMMVSYLHWGIEHVSGHHRHAATPDDPATARYGEALPAFLVRSITGSFVSAWRIELARNERRDIRSPLRNRVLWGAVVSSALTLAVGLALGPKGVLFFLAQSAVAIVLLETINYVEHYGLERRQIRPGVYERVTPLHSWNSSQRLTNALLFNLQRHSDHHAHAARPYHQLRHYPESPQLPTGYAGMALLAMVPPLWWRVMNPRVQAHRARVAELETSTSVPGQSVA